MIEDTLINSLQVLHSSFDYLTIQFDRIRIKRVLETVGLSLCEVGYCYYFSEYLPIDFYGQVSLCQCVFDFSDRQERVAKIYC